ncbi:helix-turn-helix domain-containing protein [Streptomyces pacificus]|nr:helix-turn-helix transcriptional regulator [Streptomyces pacificus]
MAPGHVAYGLQAQYGLRIGPETVVAWERGLRAPESRELTALAGVLWCSPGELLGIPHSLREHRIARAMGADELARRVGMDSSTYRRMEDAGRWRGNERQTAALAEALSLTPRELLTATGRGQELTELLRSAATTRWRAYVRPLAKMLPLPRRRLEDVLQRLHSDYHARMAATSSWGASAGSGQSGRDFLDRIEEHFWALVSG